MLGSQYLVLSAWIAFIMQLKVAKIRKGLSQLENVPEVETKKVSEL